MKKPWLAALLNFFLWGAGTLYIGKRKAVGGLMLVASLWATYVENVIVGSASPVFNPLFAAFFVVGVAMAVDAWNEAKTSV